MLAEYGTPDDPAFASLHQFLRTARALGQTPEQLLARDHRWVLLQLESMRVDDSMQGRDALIERLKKEGQGAR